MRHTPVLLFSLLSFFIPQVNAGDKTAEKTTIAQHGFNPLESSIASLHDALKNKYSNCVNITTSFLERIKKYDQHTKLNSIILVNPGALSRAKKLQDEFLKTRRLRPLHCIPVILKDNFDTADMPTEAGSIALKGSIPPDDAFMVKKLREAGAIILAKSNMDEWAFSSYRTISSSHGETRNAYDLQRVPAGSSGGSASAIAASFGIIGMGTDTGNSIRGPASHLALVGMRSTIGLTSRDGIIPLVNNRDIAGPLTRTVEDAAKTFSIIAGYDPADAVTHRAQSKLKIDYSRDLKKSALKGVRIAVMRQLFDSDTADADFDIVDLMEQAIIDLRAAGASIIEPFEIKNLENLSPGNNICSRFRYDLNHYLSSLGENPPIKNFQQMFEQKRFTQHSAGPMQWAASVKVAPQHQQPPCVGVEGSPPRKRLLNAVLSAMDAQRVDVIVYPSWNYPARKRGDSESPHGNNSAIISSHTGQPAITVPMGFTQQGLPAGLQFLGRRFSDAKLFQYAYAYEQLTKHRKPPPLFP